MFKLFKLSNRYAPFNPPPSSPDRVRGRLSFATRGRSRGGGLNGLNILNRLNDDNIYSGPRGSGTLSQIANTAYEPTAISNAMLRATGQR
jgi:hypothetical protein